MNRTSPIYRGSQSLPLDVRHFRAPDSSGAVANKSHALHIEIRTSLHIINYGRIDTLCIWGIPERAFPGSRHVGPESCQSYVEVVSKIPILAVYIDPAGMDHDRRLGHSFRFSEISNNFLPLEWDGYAL